MAILLHFIYNLSLAFKDAMLQAKLCMVPHNSSFNQAINHKKAAPTNNHALAPSRHVPHESIFLPLSRPDFAVSFQTVLVEARRKSLGGNALFGEVFALPDGAALHVSKRNLARTRNDGEFHVPATRIGKGNRLGIGLKRFHRFGGGGVEGDAKAAEFTDVEVLVTKCCR